jgi:hypothetical protein
MRILVSLLMLFLTTGVAYAEVYQSGPEGSKVSVPFQQSNQQSSGMDQEKKAPPQAFVDVCVGKSEGTACQCQGPQGAQAGTCAYTPDKQYFACRPNNMKEPSQGGRADMGMPSQPLVENSGK